MKRYEYIFWDAVKEYTEEWGFSFPSHFTDTPLPHYQGWRAYKIIDHLLHRVVKDRS